MFVWVAGCGVRERARESEGEKERERWSIYKKIGEMIHAVHAARSERAREREVSARSLADTIRNDNTVREITILEPRTRGLTHTRIITITIKTRRRYRRRQDSSSTSSSSRCVTVRYPRHKHRLSLSLSLFRSLLCRL